MYTLYTLLLLLHHIHQIDIETHMHMHTYVCIYTQVLYPVLVPVVCYTHARNILKLKHQSEATVTVILIVTIIIVTIMVVTIMILIVIPLIMQLRQLYRTQTRPQDCECLYSTLQTQEIAGSLSGHLHPMFLVVVAVLLSPDSSHGVINYSLD